MINNVVLVGRLTRDPELRHSEASNIPVVSFSLAVNRNFKNKAGEMEADFINCVAWRNQAEVLGKYARKGTMIGVVGRLQTRSYVPKNATSPDQRVYVTEVVCDSIQLLSPKNAQENRQQPFNEMGGFPQSPMQSNTGGFNSPTSFSDQGVSSDLSNASTAVDNTQSFDPTSDMSESDLPFL